MRVPPPGSLASPIPQLPSQERQTQARTRRAAPEFPSGESQPAKYRTHLDWMERIALSPQASRDFIRDVAYGL
jgi:hypothetical protein